jgi:CRISPR-associated protein (TIGR03986 family)
LQHPFAGDYDPKNREDHSRYWPDLYTGTIPVRLRTQTPLFITDPNSKIERQGTQGHYIYDCLDHIPATTLKGMLSSAYEIITNSRYRIFSQKQHKKRLGYRYQANANLVPGKVEHVDNEWKVKLFTGTSTVGSGGLADGPLYAAWIPLYGRNYGWSAIPKHGVCVKGVKIKLHSHGNFKFWSVTDNLPGGGSYTPITNPFANPPDEKTVDGYVVVTGKTISNKHDERLFFNTGTPIELSLGKNVRDNYENLVADYQRVHENGANPPIGEIKQGRHITELAYKELQNDYCFVYVKTDGRAVEALYPVQISRELYETSPWDCLSETLRPAEKPEQLSPADRLFGWVSRKESGAWRGKIRVSNGIFRGKDENDKPVAAFDEPVPLRVLGAPKPSQARFYLGDQNGNPQSDGRSKTDVGYTNGKKLRGRKIYLHHILPNLDRKQREQYWNPQSNSANEYQQPRDENELTNQNRSITGWIETKKEFFFELKVENLTAEELGAILTLLRYDDESTPYYFRLGYGKPLGLGSVALSIVNSDAPLPISNGGERAKRYGDLGESVLTGLSLDQCRQIKQAYKRAIVEAYGSLPKDAEVIERDVWKKHEFTGFLNESEQQGFEKAWNAALERGELDAPVAALNKETLDELYKDYPDLSQELTKLYKKELKDLKSQAQNDFGWSRLPFIREFIMSMRGFDNAPVHYPRNAPARGEEGFRWFTENERTGGRGLSLPSIGTALS